MKLKSARAQFKAAQDLTAEGHFEAIVSVFNNKDCYGDVVLPGAFKDSIAEWAESGDHLPVLWSHRMDDPNYNIGVVLELDELEPGDPRINEWADPFVKANGGLWVHGLIDTGPDATPIAAQALRLLKARRVTQFSYAYDETDAGPEKVGGEDVYALRKLRLYEVSPTQIGANDLTELLAAKSANPKTPASVRFAAAALIAALNDGADAPDTEPVKPRDDPEGVKRGEEPAPIDVASTRLITDLHTERCAVPD